MKLCHDEQVVFLSFTCFTVIEHVMNIQGGFSLTKSKSLTSKLIKKYTIVMIIQISSYSKTEYKSKVHF